MTGTPLASDLTVLVLAGGRSSRMGQDKALLLWQGVPLLTRVCEVAQQLASTVQVLSPWPERYESLLPTGVAVLRESTIGQGPLWALADGLKQVRTDWILLLACDMPLLNPARLQEWRSHLPNLPNTCLAYIPQTQSSQQLHWEPLCGFYRRDSLAVLTSFLSQGGQSFQQWLTGIHARPIMIMPDDEGMFFNCNRPEDWSMLETQLPPSPFPEETS